jgi:hypothetical protein
MPFDVGPLVAVIALLIFGFVGLTILVPAAAAVKRRSKLAGVIAIAVAGFWAYVWLRPEVEQAWHRGAVDECKTQLAALPEVFEGRSLLDESAGLSLRVIVQLLTERGMDVVELKPVPMDDSEPRWLMPRGHWENNWPLPTLASPYVRLRLSTTGDPACRPELNGDHFSSMPPLLPDTCLALDAVDSPSAELALEHEAAERGLGASYGFRRLIKREPRQVLAQLATSESAGKTSSLSHQTLSRSNTDVRNRDCRLPFYVLVDRVQSPARTTEPAAGPLLHTRRVKASRSVEYLLTPSSDWPKLVVAKETYAYLTQEQERATFVPEVSKPAWSAAVEAARLQDGASVSFGSRLLDLRSRTLIELQGAGPYPWKTHALLDGFFVLKGDLGWDKLAGNFLVRFDREGTFEWAAMVVPPTVQSEEPMAWPQALLVVDKKLVFADRGRRIKPSEEAPPGAESRSTQWEVPLKQLPAMTSPSGATGQRK